MNNAFGSIERDKFRWLHKFYDKLCDLSNTNIRETQTWHGTDGDFFLMVSSRKKPLALLDYQRFEEPLTSTEINLYDWCLSLNVPVYIIRGLNPDWLTNTIVYRIKQRTLYDEKYSLPKYKVYKYIKGGGTEFVTNNYIEWERNLRENNSIYNQDL